MAAASPTSTRWFPTLLWGNSIALSWTWGLGLFFSVQFTTQFGLFGLLTFAIPNAIGLLAFGLVTHHIARREKGSESLATFFTNWSRPFRLVFFLYQLLAITLTIFAFIRYGWQTLGYEPWILFMPLTLLVVLAAAILFGEEFDIRRIKFSHGVMALLLAAAIAVITIQTFRVGTGPFQFPQAADQRLAILGVCRADHHRVSGRALAGSPTVAEGHPNASRAGLHRGSVLDRCAGIFWHPALPRHPGALGAQSWRGAVDPHRAGRPPLRA